jgi:hypothetical protein
MHVSTLASKLCIAAIALGLTPFPDAPPAHAAAHADARAALARVVSAPLKAADVADPALDMRLNRVVRSPDPLAAARARGFRTRDGRLQVSIVTTGEALDELQRWLETQGAASVYAAGAVVQAFVPPDLLLAIARQPGVLAVRRPTYLPPPEHEPVRAVAASTVLTAFVSEALGPMNATAWHSAGYRGQGVKVGVIDGGFGNWNEVLGVELPPAARVHTYTVPGGDFSSGVHGLGCAEVIYDVAPEAELYLAAYDGTSEGIANAESWMVANGVKVISMSQGWLSWGAGDGTGPLADVINQFVVGGGVWVNSAGNSRLAHWQGTWQDNTGPQGYPDNILEFGMAGGSWYQINYPTDGQGSFVWLDAESGIYAALVWNQWTNPATDLDFCLYRFDGVNPPTEVTCADDEQSGQPGQYPREDIAFETTEAGYYGFGIKWYTPSASPNGVQMEMFTRFDTSPLLFNVPDGSITPPADTLNAIAAAAIDVGSFALESYSSRGPNNGSGGSLTGGAIKPDIAGYANISTSAYGAGGFSGTSCACPHVAGAAALVRSAYPAYTPSQVRAFLESRAADLGPSGKDNDYGVGRLTLGTPPASACDPPGTPSNLHASTSTVGSGEMFQVWWNAASGADSYDFQYATNPSFTSAETTSVAGTSANVRFTVGATTLYFMRVRAKRSCGSTSGWTTAISVTVTVGGSPVAYTYWIPVAANLSGSGGSHYYTDLGLLNRGAGTASVELRYHDTSGGVAGTRTESVGTGRQRIIENLLGVMGYNGKGALEIRSDQPLTATSRTYNDQGHGTFGQYYDAYTPAEGLAYGQIAVLAHLVHNAKYRSNIGVLNTGSSAVTAAVTLYSGNAQVAQFTITAAAGEYRQEDKVFERKAGLTNVPEGWARIEITTGSGAVVVASVLDNVTNDPTTIPMKP